MRVEVRKVGVMRLDPLVWTWHLLVLEGRSADWVGLVQGHRDAGDGRNGGIGVVTGFLGCTIHTDGAGYPMEH